MKSDAATVSSSSRPHKSFRLAPTKPFAKFLEAVKVVVTNAPHKGKGSIGPATKTVWGDARNLSMEAGSVDLVLTSPPYLNAIDYMAERRVRLLPPNRRYLPPPSSRHAGATLSTRMRQEVVLAFEHAA